MNVLVVSVGLLMLAMMFWPRRPYVSTAIVALIYPAMLVLFGEGLGHDPLPWAMLACGLVVRSLDAAFANRGLSRWGYLRYLVDFAKFPPCEQADAPPRLIEAAARMLRAIALIALGVAIGRAGCAIEPWRTSPYLDDLWVTLQAMVTFTGLCDLVVAASWLTRNRVPKLHDIRFLLARSTTEFWGKYWNRAFGSCLRRAIMVPLGRRHLLAGVLTVFAVNGLVHALPFVLAPTTRAFKIILIASTLLFFLIHGAGVLIDRALAHRGKRWLSSVVFAVVVTVSIPLYPGVCGALLGAHNRPQHDATILHIVPGLRELSGLTPPVAETSDGKETRDERLARN
jgi:hypothetical protein